MPYPAFKDLALISKIRNPTNLRNLHKLHMLSKISKRNKHSMISGLSTISKFPKNPELPNLSMIPMLSKLSNLSNISNLDKHPMLRKLLHLSKIYNRPKLLSYLRFLRLLIFRTCSLGRGIAESEYGRKTKKSGAISRHWGLELGRVRKWGHNPQGMIDIGKTKAGDEIKTRTCGRLA